MASRKRPASNNNFDDPSNSVGYLLRIAFRSYSRTLERRTLPFGISGGQWRFLRVLWTEDGLTQIELSRRVGMREPTTVAAVNGMERAGHVMLRKSNADRRKAYIHLTSRARRLKTKLMPFVAEVNALGLKGLSAKRKEGLRQELIMIIANLSADDGDTYQSARVGNSRSDWES